MQETIVQLLSGYPLLAPLIFVAVRALAIIIPPIPGGAIDLAGLLAFGWWKGLLYAEAGIMGGAMACFWIARYFREPAIKRFASLEKITEWEKNLSENEKFWAFVLLRLPTNALFDYISYAAGLTRISAWKFFLASLIGNIPGLFSFYFFGGLIYRSGTSYVVGFVVAILIAGFVLARRDLVGKWLVEYLKIFRNEGK